MAEQTLTGVLSEGWPVRILFIEEAYELYEEYEMAHVATKVDPLCTFSGWLHHQGIQVVDAE